MDENKGQGAIIDYNDATDLEFDSNKFTLNNVNYTIASNAVPGTSVSLTVTNDIDKAVDKVKAFVDAYNTAMSLINTKLSETREIEDHAVKYKPLTDAQKEAMTDDETIPTGTPVTVVEVINDEILVVKKS
jgi:flagellar hook-associated protein 2